MLVDWDLRHLYAELIDDEAVLADFLARVVTREWHGQHDVGRPFAETSAELAAEFPQYRALIEVYGPRFADTIPGPIPGTHEIVAELAAAGVPLFALTNFSAEFWPPVRARFAATFDRFRGILVSGEERLVKPDPAIYALARERFGLGPGEALFVDDLAVNVAAAAAAGLVGHQFRDAEALRRELVQLGLLTTK